MRCASCEKFRSTEVGEPDLEITLDDDLIMISGTVPLNCVECGTEMKQAAISIEEQVREINWRAGHCCEAEAEIDLIEPEESGKKITLSITCTLRCPTSGDLLHTKEIEVVIPRADFEEV